MVAALAASFLAVSPPLQAALGGTLDTAFRADTPGVSGAAQGVVDKAAGVDLAFVENQEQLDARVRYYIQGAEASLYFTDRGVRMSLSAKGMSNPAEDAGNKRWVIDHAFLGADSVRPVATRRSEMTVSYFKGDRADWHTGLPTFERITYRDVWPGIDLVYSGTGNALKYDLIVHPSADPKAIALTYRHARRLQETAMGALEVTTPIGSFTDSAPIAYQQRGGARVEIPASFELAGNGYGFHLGAYDASRTLVIDPEILLYAGYIGGSAGDMAFGIAVDLEGNAYVTGQTTSSEETFPETGGPDLTYGANGNNDAFVAKVTADGSALTYAGYIGGAGEERGQAIAVDESGNAFVTGYTTSDQSTFPVTGGPDLTFNGALDAFVVKVTTDGSALTYAGYLGGSNNDQGAGIAVDSSGNAYIGGTTSSSGFPTAGGPDVTLSGGDDAFVAKVTADGSALTYSGFIGGSGGEGGYGIAIDSSDNAYVTGITSSANFPTSVGPDLSLNGANDAFVAKVAADGSTLIYAGYIGGSLNDVGRSIAVDWSGAAYITGLADSDQSTFPVTGGPDLTHNGPGGGPDAFVAKVAADGSELTYAGYIGGSRVEQAQGIAVDSSGNAYVAGYTNSDEASFPVTGGPDLTFNGGFGGQDAFVAKVAADGSELTYAGYIGVNSGGAYGIAVDSDGGAYVTGYVGFGMTFPATVGPDLTFNGGSFDAFVAKVGVSNSAPACAGDSSDTPEDTQLVGTVTCTDSNGDTLTYSVADDVSHGELDFETDGTFIYEPDADYYGPDSFTFLANDGQADSTEATFDITVTEVNDAPTATDDSLASIAEDSGGRTIAASDVIGNDSPGSANETSQDLTVTLVDNPTGGTVSLTGTDITFTPTANYNGPASFDYTIQDNGTTDGAADPKSDTGTVTFTVTDVNDEPAGTDNTVTTAENTTYTSGADFGFTDLGDNPANALNRVKITTLPTDGALKNDGVNVAAGDYVTAADITAGMLTFHPGAGARGSPYASFSFQVQDDGGTANGGIDLDQSVNTMTINVTARPSDDGGGGGGAPFPAATPTPTPTPTPSSSPSPAPSTSPPTPTGTTCDGLPVTIQVTTANQTTSGTIGDDVINGTTGNDIIYGLGGNDTICGGGGNDRLYGGDRSDTLIGGAGRDKLYGGSGGGGGTYGDKLYGGAGRDLLAGDGGDDHLEGGRGNDRLYGSAGKDSLYGSAGKDSLDGGGNTDACKGGAGLDTGTHCEPFIQ